MTTQKDLFLPMCAAVDAVQPELIEQAGHARESAQLCEECAAALTATPSGYLACPNGHGKLVLDVDRIAALHRERTEWLGDDPCPCGMCTCAKLRK